MRTSITIAAIVAAGCAYYLYYHAPVILFVIMLAFHASIIYVMVNADKLRESSGRLRGRRGFKQTPVRIHKKVNITYFR
jgi:hypothetical protein